jgi:hypothetical protein
MAGFHSSQTTVGTTATLVATVATAPDTDGVLVTASTTGVFLGGAGVTVSTGLPIPATTPVLVPTTGAEPLSLFAVTATSATVSTLYPS